MGGRCRGCLQKFAKPRRTPDNTSHMRLHHLCCLFIYLFFFENSNRLLLHPASSPDLGPQPAAEGQRVSSDRTCANVAVAGRNDTGFTGLS